MSMMRFAILFPDLAERETRTVKVFDPLPIDDPRYLPPGEYGFDELYCAERRCDCRRVMINVLSRDARDHVATINHAFEKPTHDADVPEQTFLDPLNRQSRWAPALLDLFINLILPDDAYRQRLVWHYQLFKKVVNDPTHPSQRLLRQPPSFAGPSRSARSGPGSPAMPPSPAGRKRRR